MARSLKPTRRRWEPSPADLPTEKAQAVEPRLRNLENNAVFRLYTLRRGRSVKTKNEPSMARVIAAVIAVLIILALIGTMNWSLITIFVLSILIGGLNLSSKPTEVEASYYRDLCLTLLKPEDYVHGLWGSKVSRRDYFWRMIVFGVLVILIAAVASGYFWLREDIRLLCAVVLFFLGVPVAPCFNDPYYALPNAHRFLETQRRAFERKARPAAAFFQHGFESIRTILFVLVPAAVGVVLLFMLGIILAQNEWLFSNWLFSNLAGGVIALAVGLTVGWGYAVFVRKRTPHYLAKMDEHVRKILELQRSD